MLTRDDKTVSDAREIYESIADSGVRHVGCKDLGLPRDELEKLIAEIRSNGHTSYLEVVSETEEATLESARVAAEIGPDYLIGGTLIEPVQEIIEGTGIRFFPYVGQIIDHPCSLRGTIDEIAQDTRKAASARRRRDQPARLPLRRRRRRARRSRRPGDRSAGDRRRLRRFRRADRSALASAGSGASRSERRRSMRSSRREGALAAQLDAILDCRERSPPVRSCSSTRTTRAIGVLI